MVVQIHKITPRVAQRVIGLISGNIPSKRPTTPIRLINKFVAPFLYAGESQAALKVHVKEWQMATEKGPSLTTLFISELEKFASRLPSELHEVKGILTGLANSENPAVEIEKAVVQAATDSALSAEQRDLVFAPQPDLDLILRTCVKKISSFDAPHEAAASLSSFGKVIALLGNKKMALKIFQEAVKIAKKAQYYKKGSLYSTIIENMLAAGLIEESMKIADKRRNFISHTLWINYDCRASLKSIIKNEHINESVAHNFFNSASGGRFFDHREKIILFKYFADEMILQGRLEEALFLLDKACAFLTETFNNWPKVKRRWGENYIASYLQAVPLTLSIALMIQKAANLINPEKIALAKRVKNEQENWETRVREEHATLRLKSFDPAIREQAVRDYIWQQPLLPQTSASKLPKLLFHGTSAFAAWASYWNSKNFVRKLNTPPEERGFNLYRKDIPPERLAIIEKFGPLYPSNDGSDPNVCIDRLSVAYSFARWRLDESVNSKTMFALISKEENRRIRFRSDWPPPHPRVARCLEQLIKNSDHQRSESFSPGALLIVNGPELEKNNLLIPTKGEELALAQYLPWSFIRGILLVYKHTTHKKIGGYLFFDKKVGTDLIEFLRMQNGYHKFFTWDGLHWALANYLWTSNYS